VSERGHQALSIQSLAPASVKDSVKNRLRCPRELDACSLHPQTGLWTKLCPRRPAVCPWEVAGGSPETPVDALYLMDG